MAATVRREWSGGADGVSGRPVWAVTGPGGLAAGGLAAAVSGVSLDEFGTDVLARNLEDPTWQTDVTGSHRRVIEIIARQQPVVPMRLATIYPDEAAVAAMLTARRAEFTAALLNVAVAGAWPGPGGWDVTAYAAPLTRRGSARAAE